MDRKIIMIVDDDCDGREFLALYLERKFRSLSNRGAVAMHAMPKIIMAEDAERAWQLLKDEQLDPGLLVVDFQMPRMNGAELIGKIQEELKLNSEIVLYSGFFPARNEAEKLGCRFVFKLDGEKEIFELALNRGLFTDS